MPSANTPRPPIGRPATADILMITHERAEYTRRSLPLLLASCDESARVWLWHNGNDRETLEVVREHVHHDRVHRFHHSPTNEKLTVPTNWMWERSDADLFGKVDDDCLVPKDWIRTFRAAHRDEPDLGIVAAWHFPREDIVPDLAERKVRSIGGTHRLMVHPWVGGSGYLMKRRCVEDRGPLRPGISFTRFCLDVALSGYVNGWYYPFVLQDHMDDPRSPHTALRSDEDLRERSPLSVARTDAQTLADWQAQLRASALYLQTAAPDARLYLGWRAAARRMVSAVSERFGGGFRR